ncbi:MAG TPA: GTPase HflX [Nannocystaceae bacterium]|nr:GTPase HflX [Nannocystaceae bacterium]
MTNDAIFGDTANLKVSHVKSLGRLGQRHVPADRVVSSALARDVVDLAHELNRRIGLFVDRRGRVVRVILGDTHSLQLPEFDRVRGADGRLRGVRLVVAHLVPEALDREELADLMKLRLDAVAAIHRGPAGLQVDMASLAPAAGDGTEAFTTRTWPRTALALLSRDDETIAEETELPVAFDVFLRELEGELVAATTRARALLPGTRAMALLVHDGGPHVAARKAELRELCRTDGLALVELVEQRRPLPDPRTFFGQGKLRQVLVRALEQDVEVLICDPELTASQARTISEETDLKVIDRTMLILDIFARHAKSSDGKLQVELAQLRYNLPKMVGKGTMMSRLMGGIGGRGPGETKLEIDRRRAKERISDLEHRLQTLRKRRAQQRAERRRTRVPVAAIVGYTNAGKSTLLNTVTNSSVDAENKLFATLDPTVRRLRFPQDREIVLLDTVGFIRALPPALRQAFSATLEEVAEADLLLHVIDAGDPDREEQIATVERILHGLGAARVPRLRVFNKVDLLPPRELEALRERESAIDGPPVFFVSAMDRRSTRPLMIAIEEQLWSRGRIERPEHEAFWDAASADDAANTTEVEPDEAADDWRNHDEAQAQPATKVGSSA